MERIVDIATDGLHLSTHRGFLIVEQERKEIGRIALDDIHAVLVHAHGVTWSTNLVMRLAVRGAPVIFCDASHVPSFPPVTTVLRGSGMSVLLHS